jgi:type I restriction enzyme M protein
LIESGDVDALIAIRGNFFCTRTVPCELWFFDRGRPAAHRDTVLMLDARNTFRKVTRKIYDFSPERLANLTAIVWLYRGERERFIVLVKEYIERTLGEAGACVAPLQKGDAASAPLAGFVSVVRNWLELLTPFVDTLGDVGTHGDICAALAGAKLDRFGGDLTLATKEALRRWKKLRDPDPAALEAQNAKLGQARDLLLPRLMSGEIEV